MAVLCQLADPQAYRPCDWDYVNDLEDFAYWLDLFGGYHEVMERHLREDGLTGPNFEARWRVFREEYDTGIAERRAHPERFAPLSTISLGRFRQSMMDRHGWPDPFLIVKQRENALAAKLYPSLVQRIDQTVPPARWAMLLRGIFAGNMFDLGCPDTIEMYNRGEISFEAILERLPERPWVVDDADTICERLESPECWRRVLFFVDNSGTDVVLGAVPMAREMARRGMRVVLAANATAALNDVTYDELNPLLAELGEIDPILGGLLADGRITTVSTGSGSPLIDLGRISDACNAVAEACDLVVLEGMGRAIESNWRATFTCDVWHLALLKDRTVVKWMKANLFDPVCRFKPAVDSAHPA